MERRQQYSLLVFLMCGLLCIQFYMTGSPFSQAKQNYEKAVVISTEIVDLSDAQVNRKGQIVKLRLLTGPDTGKVVESFNNLLAAQLNFDRLISPGDRIFVSSTEENGVKSYYFSDFNRTPYFLILFAIFVCGLLFFGRYVGFRSLIAMGITLILLWHWVIAYMLEPTVNIYILTGVFCAFISCSILLIVSGISAKTLAALLGTLGGLAFASLLSYFSIKYMHLTGIDTEEAYMLKAHVMPHLDFHGILFASKILVH